MLHGRLRHAERQPAIDCRSHRDLVNEAAINTNDGNDTEVPAAMDCLTQYVRPVRSHEGCNLYSVHDRVGACHGFGLGADCVDAGIGTASLGEFHDPVVDVFLHEIERFGATAPGKVEPLRNGIDCDDPFGPQQKSALDCKLSDWAAAPDRDCLTAFEIAELRAHVTGRKNVGEEEHLLVVKALRHLQRPYVGVWHSQIFRLTARVAAEQMRISEQAGWRVTPELGCLLMVRIRSFAAREISALAKEALAAGDGERHDHAVADLQFLVFGADFDYLPHRFVTENVAAL